MIFSWSEADGHRPHLGGTFFKPRGILRAKGCFKETRVSLETSFGRLLSSSRIISRVHCLAIHQVVTDEMYFPSSKGNIRDVSRAIFIAALATTGHLNFDGWQLVDLHVELP